jgi:RNA polymerase sigma factor (sigma-70 family)
LSLTIHQQEAERSLRLVLSKGWPMDTDTDLTALALEAQNGSKAALETLVGYAQGYIYNLALRMTQLPMDAEDATQEILIKLVTQVGQFRAESSYTTWMYRIASNHLLTMRTRDKDATQLSFDVLTERLEMSVALYDAAAAADSVEESVADSALAEEVRRGCTLGMMMCLSREDRLTLVLGEVLNVTSDEGAAIMGTSAVAFRKRLSRARQALVAFVSQQCGIVNPESPCRCHKHVRNKVRAGQLDPHHLHYQQPHDAASLAAAARAADPAEDSVCRTTALLRSHPTYANRTDYIAMLRQVFAADDPDLV